MLALGLSGCTGSNSPSAPRASDDISAAGAAALPPLLPAAASPAARATDAALAQALDAELAKPQYEGLRSVIVLAHGRTAYERYFDSRPTDRHQVWSVTKSVIGTLIGIALAQGHLSSLDATLDTLLPAYADRMSPGQADVTLERLLTMSGGFISNPPGMDGQAGHDDWIASLLEYSPEKPRNAFSYSNATSHLLAAILEEATGQSTLDYARTVLFAPLGIETEPAEEPVASIDEVSALNGPAFGWATDPQGRNLGPYGLRLRAQDLAKLGLLYLRDGAWEGRQVVPKQWVRAATRDRVDGDPAYGYQWWADERGFAASGYGGQGIWVFPEDDLVFVSQVWIDPVTGNEQGVGDEVGKLFESTIYPAVAGPSST
ncbi:MAG TPA: serine hydrolase [Candidatus Nanopelagicales bacterium]